MLALFLKSVHQKNNSVKQKRPVREIEPALRDNRSVAPGPWWAVFYGIYLPTVSLPVTRFQYTTLSFPARTSTEGPQKAVNQPVSSLPAGPPPPLESVGVAPCFQCLRQRPRSREGKPNPLSLLGLINVIVHEQSPCELSAREAPICPGPYRPRQVATSDPELVEWVAASHLSQTRFV